MNLNNPIINKGAEVAVDHALNETNRYKEAIAYIRSIPKEIVKETVMIGPNFIKFTITALNHSSADTKTKLMFTGIIISISTLLGFMIWDISLIALLFTVGAFAGPMTVIVGAVFGSLIVLIKSSLTAFLILVAMKLSNMMYEDGEIRDIAIETFGEEKGESFLTTFKKLANFGNESIGGFIKSVEEYFIKLGKKTDKIDLSEIEAKIDSRTEETVKEEKKIDRSKLLNKLKLLKREDPLDEAAVILVLTLLNYAINIDGHESDDEREVLIDFIKSEYILDNSDIEKLFKMIDHDKDIEELLNEIKEIIPTSKVDSIIEVVENIIIADGVVTEEEQLLLDIVKKQLKG